jgi:hypothetical protein
MVRAGSCSNVWPRGTAKVSYYEAGDNKGLPAIVPFDLREGWYAMVSNSGGTFIDDSPQGYTASGDVRHFKICNIGANGLMQNCAGDDVVKTFNINTAGDISKFGECPNVDAKRLYEKAREAIRQASQQYGEKQVNIFDEMVELGRPMSQVGGFECQDFMSPSDCKMMFNVCDPVICPPSRCDFGGKFPVSDVIQTGVIGSLVLCLPNAKEGIFMPVCLSGVQAGLDAYLSILKSERECLETSLESGELVGICDQISSIYKCEFFWRQMAPLMDQLIPGVIEFAVGGGSVRGGGEYALAEQSWNSMRKGVDYFKNVYAQNAMRAFNVRSTQEVGSSVCKAFVGTSVPGSADFIEDLLAPESPSQFYAQFSEQLFTEATVPSTSQYKVYYHIFAGKDQGVQYKIYMRNPPASSYYATNPEVAVKSGYIAAGSSADESVDFTAPSGYKELCVVINAQEECGFKQVTTDFGLDFISKKYVEEQAGEEDIKTEKECISGSPSALSMASLNIEAGVDEVINPEIAMRGIVRICASANPESGISSGNAAVCEEDSDCGRGFECSSGKCVDKGGSGTVESSGGRWKDVGYCGDASLRCWLDVDSVKDDLEAVSAIEGKSIRVLDERRGLIENERLGLEGVSAVLASAREGIKKLATEGGLQKAEEEGKRIVGELETVIGNEVGAGAGTNGNRAEALSLKASVYRLLSMLKIESDIENKTGGPVVDSRDSAVGGGELGIGSRESVVGDEGEGVFGDVGLGARSCGDCGGGFFDVCEEEECLRISEDCEYDALAWERCTGGDEDEDVVVLEVEERGCDVECSLKSGYSGGENVEDAAACWDMSDDAVYVDECCCFLDGDEDVSLEELMRARKDCDCGENCGDYALWIEKYSKENGIDDPLRVLSVMIQESNCVYDKKNPTSGAYGLMQIMSGSFGDICEGELSGGDDYVGFDYVEQNVECGVKILARKYRDYNEGVEASWSWRTAPSDGGFENYVRVCVGETQTKYAGYSGWDAAMRGYNGWGCGEGANVDYVEEVNVALKSLRG